MVHSTDVPVFNHKNVWLSKILKFRNNTICYTSPSIGWLCDLKVTALPNNNIFQDPDPKRNYPPGINDWKGEGRARKGIEHTECTSLNKCHLHLLKMEISLDRYF